MTAKNYEAWEVQESDYPRNGTMEEQLTFLLRYAILAPSGPNTQPWKFAISGNIISVFADLERSLIHVDPDNRTLFMSVGCAIANLVTAGKHFGFSTSLNYFPEGQGSDLVAEVKFEQARVARLELIYFLRSPNAILQRTDTRTRRLKPVFWMISRGA